jgi:hypothetical protein
MALTMEFKKQRLLLGVGLAILGYFVLKNVIAKKMVSSDANKSNFVNADGSNNSFVALKYDPSYKNPDGTLGATWIGYNNSDVVGYWQKGVVTLGTAPVL